MRKPEMRGFTLVEVVLTAALFSVVLVSLYAAVDMARVIFHTNNVYSQVTQSTMQTLRYISREIGQSSPVQAPAHLNIADDDDDNSMVRFQIPVDWDNDGDAVAGDLSPEVEWGAYNEAGHTRACHADTVADPECAAPDHEEIVGRWVRYRMDEGPTEEEGDEQLVREVLDAGFNALDDSMRVVANHVSAFEVQQDGTDVVMTMTVTAEDAVGQSGAGREFETTVTSRTLLRNALE